MVAPTILAHAQDHVKERYLPKMYRGDIIGAQLFSEPGAGSDLAGLQTKAERDGDEWIITGQKVWTSGAHYADIGEIICRTDPDLPKHKGLTGFVIDMKAPGVEIRPLRQMTGGASFNEVFFDGLRVPDDHRLGDVNGGWTVALTTLLNERASIGAGGGGGGMGGSATPPGSSRCCGTSASTTTPSYRQELASVYIGFQVAKWNNQRAMDKIKAGQAPGPELSGAKLSLTAQHAGRHRVRRRRCSGPRLVADTGEWGTYAWGQFVCGVPGHARGRRHRRGAPQDHRRAGARPPQGARHRHQEPVQGPPQELTRTIPGHAGRGRVAGDRRAVRSSAGRARRTGLDPPRTRPRDDRRRGGRPRLRDRPLVRHRPVRRRCRSTPPSSTG